MEAFKEFKKLDDQIIQTSQNLLRFMLVENAGIGKTQKEALQNIMFAGSLCEGAVLARIFKPDATHELNREFEVDLEFNGMEIPVTKKNIIRDIPGKEGFVNILNDEEVLSFSKAVGWKISDEDFKNISNDQGFLQAYRLKEEILPKVKFRNDDKKVELILAAALDINLDSVSLSPSHHSVTKSSIDNEIKLYVDGDLKVGISWDVVLVFRIMWWPQVAQEWKERKRNWPCDYTIASLTKVGYIITKPSDAEKANKNTVELRYSFAHIERELVSRRGSHQNFIYFLFKSMIYKWIKPLNPDNIHSFVGKTIMFWTCEEYPPEDSFWNEDEGTIYKTLKYLFNELKIAFQKGFMPYYFIKKINVIENVEPQLALAIIQQITLMETDIRKFLPNNIHESMSVAKEMLCLAESTITIMDHFKNLNFQFFHQERPRLCAKILEIMGPKFLKKLIRDTENAVHSVDTKKLEESIKKFFK